jgi:hypothetical protein
MLAIIFLKFFFKNLFEFVPIHKNKLNNYLKIYRVGSAILILILTRKSDSEAKF